MTRTALLAASLLLASAGHAAVPPIPAGEHLEYSVRYAAAGTVDVAGALFRAKPDPHRIETRLVGTLVVESFGDNRALLRWSAATLVRQADGGPTAMDGEMDALSRPVAVRLTDTGAVAAVGFPSDLPPTMRSLWRTLISGLQLVHPAGAAATWAVVQEAPARPVRARYRTVPGGTVVRTDEDAPLVRAIGPKGDPGVARTFRGERRFGTDAGAVVSIAAAVTTDSTVAGRFLAKETETWTVRRVARRRLTESERSAGLAAAGTALANGTPLSARDRDPGSTRRAWEQALGATTGDELRARLVRVDSGAERADGDLFTQLCAWIVVDAGSVARLSDTLGPMRGDGPGMRAAVSALASVAGDAEAVPEAAVRAEAGILALLAKRGADGDSVATLAPALAASTHPSAAAWERLEALSESLDPGIASPARLALGGIARFCPSEVRKRLVDRLCGWLDAAKGEDAGVVLAALGNAGSVDALPWLLRHAATGSPLRATAVSSLRFVPGAAATARLRAALADTDPELRIAASRAFQWRPFTPAEVALVVRRLRVEPEPRVRAELYENLLLEREHHAGIETAVRGALAAEREPELRASVARRISVR